MDSRITERSLLTELEQGNGEHLHAFFDGKFEEERLASVHKMQKMFLDDVHSGAAPRDALQFQTDQWFGVESIDISGKDNTLYHDRFQITDLKHSDPKDVVPSDRKAIDPAEVRRVTTDLEHGDPSSLKSVLAGMYAEEEIRYLDAVNNMNTSDLASHATDIELSVGGTPHKDRSHIEVSLQRAGRNWYSGYETLFKDRLNTALVEHEIYSKLDDR